VNALYEVLTQTFFSIAAVLQQATRIAALAYIRSVHIPHIESWQSSAVRKRLLAAEVSVAEKNMASTTFASLLLLALALLAHTRSSSAALQHHERAAAFEGYNEVHAVAASAKADAVVAVASASPPPLDEGGHAAQPAPASDFEFVITTSYGRVRASSLRLCSSKGKMRGVRRPAAVARA
jgi:hypothetical protein